MKLPVLMILSLLLMNFPSYKRLLKNDKEHKAEGYCVTLLCRYSNQKDSEIDAHIKVLYSIWNRHAENIKSIKPIEIVKGTMLLPYRIHFLTFSSLNAIDKMKSDPEYVSVLKQLRNSFGAEVDLVISKNAKTNLILEIGDATKIYAITLITYKKGETYKQDFENYLEKACTIMPEFGVHFEKMLLPIAQQGEVNKFDRLHLFYFDSPKGIEQLTNDKRMQELFPLRDQSVSEATLILGSQID